MIFLAPFWLAAAAVAALGAVAVHFITTRRPPPAPLPTARFVPAGEAQATARTARPDDRRLLALRVTALALLGAAFARPVWRHHAASLARVVVVDASRSVRADTRDSALVQWRPGDALVVFDTGARATDGNVTDSIRAVAVVPVRGALSAALVVARRAAPRLARSADSLELVLVSPLTADEVDSATAPLLRGWPGRIRIVRPRAAVPAQHAVTLTSTDVDDPLRAAVAASSVTASSVPASAATNSEFASSAVRVTRTELSGADSAAARAGTAMVYWPQAALTTPRAMGLSTRSATVVAPFVRLPVPEAGTVVARWADGTVAAAESPMGRGCLRTVGVGIGRAGDVPLDPAFLAVARDLLAPCDGVNVSPPVADSVIATWGAGGTPGAAWSAGGAVQQAAIAAGERSPLAAWLMALALLLLAAELVVRRPQKPGVA